MLFSTEAPNAYAVGTKSPATAEGPRDALCL